MATTAASSKAQPQRKRHPYRGKKAPPPAEPVQALGGRLWIVLIMMLPVAFFPYCADTGCSKAGETVLNAVAPVKKDDPAAQTGAPKAKWKVGETMPIEVTLITADYNKLACAHAEAIEGYHCAYKSDKAVWPREPGEPLDDNKKSIIQPYRTPAGDLIFIAGLWAEPNVAMRLHKEPPYSRRENKLARFVANCDMKFIGQLKAAKMRWAPGGRWITEGDPLVAKPIKCRVR